MANLKRIKEIQFYKGWIDPSPHGETKPIDPVTLPKQAPLYPGGVEIEEITRREYCPNKQAPFLPGGVEIEPEPTKEED